jgi:hypothetical protein
MVADLIHDAVHKSLPCCAKFDDGDLPRRSRRWERPLQDVELNLLGRCHSERRFAIGLVVGVDIWSQDSNIVGAI